MKSYLEDRPTGGVPPGSYEARLAIYHVGVAICGMHWSPGQHLIKDSDPKRPRACPDCGCSLSPRVLRCAPCNDLHRRMIARESKRKARERKLAERAATGTGV